MGLVLKSRAKLRIVNKSMLMYNEHRVFIRGACIIYLMAELKPILPKITIVDKKRPLQISGKGSSLHEIFSKK